MFKKIMVFISTVFILLSCFIPFSVSADYDPSYDYKSHWTYNGVKNKHLYEIIIDYYRLSTDNTGTRSYMFNSLPTLFYDSSLNVYYLYCPNGITTYNSSNKGGSDYSTIHDYSYVYFDFIDSRITGMECSKNKLTYVDFSDASAPHPGFEFGSDYEKKSDLKLDFLPNFDESVPESDINKLFELLGDDYWKDYYDNVKISVTPESLQEEISRFDNEIYDSPFLREDYSRNPNLLLNSPAYLFFTVKIENKGTEPFVFLLTANEKSYIHETSSNIIDDISSDCLNIFSINGNQYITIPAGVSWSYNFNFEEIDHLTTYDHSKGFTVPQFNLFLNIWTKTPGRVVKGIPSWNGLDEYPGDTSSWETEKYQCAYSHDFTFKGFWTQPVKKADGYTDVIKNSPVADLLVDGLYNSVEFDFNPEIDDFKDMLDSSKGFLEFVRYTMASFVPQFFWVIIAAGITSIVILRILGR